MTGIGEHHPMTMWATVSRGVKSVHRLRWLVVVSADIPESSME